MNTTEDGRVSTSDQQRGSATLSSKSQMSLKQQLLEEVEEKRENLKRLLENIYDRENQHQSDTDVSLQPSFSKFQVPYFIKCRNRYNTAKKLYEQRFQYEIEQLIAQQATAYEASRLNRHVCITAMWPPLHSQSEIIHSQRHFSKLTNKERKRLNWIMNTNII